MYGQAGGTDFEDKVTSANLRRIVIRCGKDLDGLKCEYDNETTTDHHGGQRGSEYFFGLDKDDPIITVNIWAGHKIDAIQFQTIKGRLSDKYGGGGGQPFICGGVDGRERALMGFKGRSQYGINQLEPIWSTTRDLGIARVSERDFRGGYGGGQFNMLQAVGDPLTTTLRTIVVSSGARIDTLQCIFQDGRESGYQGRLGGDRESGYQNRGGGTDHRFELSENERVVRIEGRSNARIDQLQFVTNLQRYSLKFGGNGGTPFVWTPPFEGGNISLLCFQGRSGWEIDRLAPVWAVDQKQRTLAKLKGYDTRFLVDDSDSMDGPRWTTTKQVMAHIAPIAVKYDKNGVDIRFFNNYPEDKDRLNLDSAEKVISLFDNLELYGWTPTADTLDLELNKYIHEYKNNRRIKGLNLIVITDGEPSPGQDVVGIVVKYARILARLDAPPLQVGIQFVQVGDDKGAKDFLDILDNDLQEKYNLDRNMVDTVRWIDSDEDRLYEKILLGGILKRLDHDEERKVGAV